jgi:coenzyme F420-0:L-glutamate ligase/coenzyme F420-1:gamma-L-glutamate ligase
MFGYGAREAVVRALRGDPGDRAPFGTASDADTLAAALVDALGDGLELVRDGDGVSLEVLDPRLGPAVAAVAFAHGWQASPTPTDDTGTARLGLRPITP